MMYLEMLKQVVLLNRIQRLLDYDPNQPRELKARLPLAVLLLPIVFRIKSSSVSKTTADITPFSGFRNMESEVLMSAKQKMRATHIQRLDDTGSEIAYIIDVEPVD